MAKTSVTSATARCRAAGARVASFLPCIPHRFLRVLAASPKFARRRRRRILTAALAVSPSSSKRRKYAVRSQTSSLPREVERPENPKRLEAEQQQLHEAHAPDVAAAAAEAVAGKYWAHRHSLFSLYDRGVRMDAEGWYSATPETIAAAQAARAAPAGLVVDAFAGVGGNSIQFAARGCYVLAVEIDPRKVELAMHNAKIYGVEGRIEFVVGDFFRLAPFLKADLVFLSPPWGGPSYNQTPIYTLDMLKPKDGFSLFQAAQRVAPNIIMFLPRNVDISQVEELSWLSSPPLDFQRVMCSTGSKELLRTLETWHDDKFTIEVGIKKNPARMEIREEVWPEDRMRRVIGWGLGGELRFFFLRWLGVPHGQKATKG